MPIRITGFPGSLPFKRTWPLIVPTVGCLSAGRDGRLVRDGDRERQGAWPPTGRRRLSSVRLILLGGFGGRFKPGELVGIPILQVAVLASLIDSFAGVQERFCVLRIDRFQGGHSGIVQPMRQLDPGLRDPCRSALVFAAARARYSDSPTCRPGWRPGGLPSAEGCSPRRAERRSGAARPNPYQFEAVALPCRSR